MYQPKSTILKETKKYGNNENTRSVQGNKGIKHSYNPKRKTIKSRSKALNTQIMNSNRHGRRQGGSTKNEAHVQGPDFNRKEANGMTGEFFHSSNLDQHHKFPELLPGRNSELKWSRWRREI